MTANMADAIALWLADQGLVTYHGANFDVFIDTMPSSPGEAVMISVNGGPANALWTEGDRTPTVQILVRGTQFPLDSEGRAADILAALPGLDQTVIEDSQGRQVRIAGAAPRQSAPVRVGQDENSRHRHSINFDVHAGAAG